MLVLMRSTSLTIVPSGLLLASAARLPGRMATCLVTSGAALGRLCAPW